MQLAKVTPNMLENEGSWDPVVLCGPMSSLLGDSCAGSLDTWDASILDGSRVAERSTFGAADIGFAELRISHERQTAPASSRHSVRTGDVLLAKAPPIKAAWISPSVQQLRFDATCYAVRNLDTAQGVWLTFLLNQKEYAFCLARRSVASAMPRINTNELRRFPIPEVPEGFERIASGIANCLDKRSINSLELVRLQGEVASLVESMIPAVVFDSVDEGHDRTESWYRRFHAQTLEDSLIPGHVKAGEFQQILKRNGDWRPINSLVSLARGHGERLGQLATQYHCLRLSDVGSDLRVPMTLSRGLAGNRNVYAEPLQIDEVLHSLLATSPRTVFVCERPDYEVYPTDHWVRLKFNETPGAWALVMQTEAIARQLRSMTTGLTQQFATPIAVQQLVLPPLPPAVRQSWDSRLRRWQRQRNELDLEWFELVDRVYRLLKVTEAKYGPWVTPYFQEAIDDA